MAHIVADRIKETTSTTGTGSLTLTGAVAGFKTIASRLTADGDTGWFCAVNGSEWEVFLGTRSSASVLARTAVLASSNADAAVNFSAAPTVFATVPAAAIKQTTDAASIYLNAATNTTNAGWQKVPLNAALFDTNSIFDSTNKKITPKKPGYYQVNFYVRTATSGLISAVVYKTGAGTARFGEYVNEAGNGGSVLVYCNGTTDYLELYCYATTVRAFSTGEFETLMQVVGPL